MYYSVVFVSFEQRKEVFEWCQHTLGKWLITGPDQSRDWTYRSHLVNKKYASVFGFYSPNDRLLFDLRWSRLDIYHSLQDYYQAHQPERIIKRTTHAGQI